ncbi:MAG: efflux RND transporter periplasmic adaptor subunit [Nitrospiraceae bacterium]|nr:MAG: efflux RND transporter periplasmic adaptor subunit [Nitrospiraceae bacterium]
MPNEDITKLRIDKGSTAFRPEKRKRYFRRIVIIACLIIISILYLAGVFAPAVEVEVATVSQIYPSQAFTVLNASGYVVAQRKAAVASKATGQLVSLKVEEGSRVKKDEILAQLENADSTALRNRALANLETAKFNLDQAKAELHDAMLSFNRQDELLKLELTAKAAYESADARYKKAQAVVSAAEAAVRAAQASLKEAEASLDYTFIRAPFDAVVLTKNADIGDIVTPLGAAANAKAAVVTIADMDSLQVEVDVSESNISLIKIGQPCEIILDAIHNVRFPGEVHMIVPTADRTKASVMVKVKFTDKDSRILPEMSAKVAFLERAMIQGEEKPRTSINPSAIITDSGKQYVFTIKGENAMKTEITTGEKIGNMFVASGVKAGDRVVLNPSTALKDGVKIKIREK